MIVLKGDVNLDGNITIDDAIIAGAIADGTAYGNIPDDLFYAADIDNSGTITVSDVEVIVAHVQGYTTINAFRDIEEE